MVIRIMNSHTQDGNLACLVTGSLQVCHDLAKCNDLAQIDRNRCAGGDQVDDLLVDFNIKLIQLSVPVDNLVSLDRVFLLQRLDRLLQLLDGQLSHGIDKAGNHIQFFIEPVQGMFSI